MAAETLIQIENENESPQTCKCETGFVFILLRSTQIYGFRPLYLRRS